MELYPILMGIGGMLTLVGILLTWNLSRIVHSMRRDGSPLHWLVLVGGLITATGFVLSGSGLNQMFIETIILLGPAIIALALSESGLIRATVTLFIQSALLLLSLFFTSPTEFEVVSIASALAILLLINGVRSYPGVPKREVVVSGVSSWFLILAVWLNGFKVTEVAGALIYILSLSLWLYVLAVLHPLASAGSTLFPDKEKSGGKPTMESNQ
jgi:hypothetical protein